MHFIIGIIIILAFLLFLNFIFKNKKQYLPEIIKWLFIIGALIVAYFILRTGQIHLAATIGFFAALLPFVNRFISLFYFIRNSVNIFRFFKSKSKSKAKTEEKKSKTKTKVSKMDIDEACSILGVKKNASTLEIKSAYQRLMKQNHPDKGGTEYIAQKLNFAKDTLMKLKDKKN